MKSSSLEIPSRSLNGHRKYSAVKVWSKLSLGIFKPRHQSTNGNLYRSSCRRMLGLAMNNSIPFMTWARRPSFWVHHWRNRRISQPPWMFSSVELLPSKLELFVSNEAVPSGTFSHVPCIRKSFLCNLICNTELWFC